MNKLGIFMNFWETKWDADYGKYIRKAAELGYDILEFQAQPLLDIPDERLRDIRRLADSCGVELSYSLGLDPRYDIANRDPEVRARGVQYLKDIVYKIQVMGGELFSGVTYAAWGATDMILGPQEKAELLDYSVDSMRQVMKEAEKSGVTVCVEAVNRFESVLINTAAEAIAYTELVDSPNIGVHLDTYHMNIEEKSIGDAIRLVGKRMRHFHTGENNRTVPGRGHIDWDEVFGALQDIGYKGNIVSEPFVLMGGEVGRSIKTWRPLIGDGSEAALDEEARYLLRFTRGMLEKYPVA